MRVPCLADFGTVQSFANGKTMKLDRTLCGNELQDMKSKLLQALFEVQSRVVDLRHRLIRLPAQALDTADE